MGVLCEAERKKKVDNKSNEIPINKIPINEIPTNEALIGGIKPTELDPCMSYASKSFCKIFCQGFFGSGFLIKLYKNDQDFFCLMTCGHVVEIDKIEKGKKVSFYYDSIAARLKEIELNKNERFIINFNVLNEDIDVTVIEILPKDNISPEFFLSPNLYYINNFDELEKQNIAILQYPKGKLAQAYGKIKDIYKDKYGFSHTASTEKGSSGSPIFLKDSIEVVGIHKTGVSNNSENYGNFIGPVFNFFKNFPKIKKLQNYRKRDMENNSETTNKLDMYIAYASKSICQIKTKENVSSSGFLLKLFKGEKEFYCLVTCEYVVEREMIQKRETISFIYDNANAKTKIIKLDPDKRFIQDFYRLFEVDKNINIDIDATIIEILPEDNIPEDYFLSINENYINNFDNLKNQDIALIGYPLGELKYSFGRIKEIEEYKIVHLAMSEDGIGGCPIFLRNTLKVIGIHESRSVNYEERYGYCLGPIYNYFKNFSENKNELNIDLYKKIKILKTTVI